MERDTIEERAERHHDEGQRKKTRDRAKPGRATAADGGDGEHDRQRFHRLDQRGQERGRHDRSDMRPVSRHAMPP